MLHRWTWPRVAVGVVLGGLLALDLYATYSGWFGWDHGGMNIRRGIIENWDNRTGRGVALSVPLVIGLLFVLWGWPRIIDRIRSERVERRRAIARYQRVHTWD